MRVILRAKRKADTVAGLLSRNSSWRVSLKFARGFLLESEGDSLFIGGPGISRGPYHVLLPEPQFALLQSWSVGLPLRSGNGRLLSDTAILEAGAANGYATTVSRLSDAGAAFGRHILEDYLHREKAPTGLGFRVSQLLDEEGHLPVAVETLVCDPSGPGIQRLADYLAGRGRGLTPAGDDFLVGMAAILPDWPQLHCQIARLAVAEEITTTVSRCYFRQALRRRFDLDVTAMVTAMNKKRETALRFVLGRILGHGHSSGLDLLTGVLFALRMLTFAASRRTGLAAGVCWFPPTPWEITCRDIK